MQSSDNSNIPVIPVRKCPHLGLSEDNQTWSATDLIQNCCHCQNPPQPVDWDYQCRFCFTDEYSACPFLKNQVQPPPIPAWHKRRPVAVFATLLLLILMSGALVLWKTGFPPLFKPAFASLEQTQPALTATPVIPTFTIPAQSAPSNTPVPPPTPTLLPTSTTSHTPTAKPSLTATQYLSPTPGPALMTPFGAHLVYVVHQIREGESIERLSLIYNTSDPVIRALNGINATDVLWADRVIVVLPGVVDPSGVQMRKPVYLENDSTVQNLATLYDVTVGQMRADNDLGKDDFVPGKRWLVVP